MYGAHMTQREDKNPLMQDLFRGLTCRCPKCGEGKMFGKFLKVNKVCAHCGEELDHHRADDFPAYLVVLILGHMMVPFALGIEEHFSPPYWVHMVSTIPLTLILAIALLQPVKGMIVAIQWRLHMHGFALSRDKASS